MTWEPRRLTGNEVAMLDEDQKERKPDKYDSTGAMAAAWFGITGAVEAINAVFPSEAQQERKPHTEADVQRIIFSAYETFGRKGFEDVVRETLGVPAP